MAHLFICPNCGNRTTSSERTAGFRREARGCSKCGFGFLFELMEGFYPAPNTGFVVCDAGGRILAAGRGVFELTGWPEEELMGHDVVGRLDISGYEDGKNPVALALEWGVRRLGEHLEVQNGTPGALTAEARKECKRCFCARETIHATCEPLRRSI